MARLREKTVFLSRQTGVVHYPGLDLLQPETALLNAINVWMGSPAGICTKRAGTTALTLHANCAGKYLIGLFTARQATSLHLITQRSDDDDYWYISAARNVESWSEVTVPAALRSAGTLPTQSAAVNSKAICAGVAGVSATRPAVIDWATGSPVVRQAGFSTPEAPTVANTGSGSYAATLRYYRVRYTQQVSGVTVRRSEPSASASFTPSGSGTAARVTKPAALTAEAETHWELEASTDNAVFYRIATTAVGTTTYDDSASTSTYSSNTLSEDVGDRLPPPATRSVVVDGGYVLYIGSTATYDSRIYFSRPQGTTDVADEECVQTENYFDIDADDGDYVTAGVVLLDAVYVFKQRSLHRLIPTGNVTAPYQPVKVADLGISSPQYVCVVPSREQVGGIYFGGAGGAYRYNEAGLACLSGPVVDATGWTNVVWPDSWRVVYYRGRQQVLFGRWAYSLITGGWSYQYYYRGALAQQVVLEDPGLAFKYGQVVMPGIASGLYATVGLHVWDDYVSSPTTDFGTAYPVLARVQFPRLALFGWTVKWLPTRCRVWATRGTTGPQLLTVGACETFRRKLEPTTLPTESVVPLGHVELPSAVRTGEFTMPPNLGIGAVEFLALDLQDSGDGSWTLDAVEISGTPQEPAL